jgi:hypothetical protein
LPSFEKSSHPKQHHQRLQEDGHLSSKLSMQ